MHERAKSLQYTPHILDKAEAGVYDLWDQQRRGALYPYINVYNIGKQISLSYFQNDEKNGTGSSKSNGKIF